MKLFVGNLPFKTTEDDVRELFEAYGEVQSVKIIKDHDTGRSRGFGFVEMDEGSATSAIEALNNSDFAGRPLHVDKAKDRPRRVSAM